MSVTAYSFGPFRLDLRAHRLLRDGVPVDLSAHLVDLLIYLVRHEGELIERDRLLDAVWPGVFVTDNAVTRAVSDLRHALGDDPREPLFIQTATRRGYRFVAGVSEELEPQPSRVGEEAEPGDTGPPGRTAGPGRRDRSSGAPPMPGQDADWLALRDLVSAIPELEAFDLARLRDVRARLRAAAERLPGYAPVHVALANAGAIAFEASRTSAPDRAALEEALGHARRGCTADPALAEAWATLAFVLTVSGIEPEEARAAARRAAMMEPDSWRHHFRLAFAAWGDERLRAVSRTLALMPGMPYACLAGAMVHVARGAFAAALDLLDRALPAAVAGDDAPVRLPAAGLDWLRGAVLGAAPDPASQQAAFEHAMLEIRAHDATRLYATEFAVNAWHWQAGWRHRHANRDGAAAALDAALHLNPRHARSAVALAAVAAALGRADATALSARADDLVAALRSSGREADAATCDALGAALRGEPDRALRVLGTMLAHAPAGHAGWTTPIDPWFAHLQGTPALAHVLQRLAGRAV